MTKTTTAPKKPARYRYIGIEDIKIGGVDVRNGDEFDSGRFVHGEMFAHDKRFEEVTDKT